MRAPWARSVRIRDWLLPRVLELTYTAWDLKAFADDCGDDGPPFIWDPERRFQLRCEIDAAFFHLYGISRDDTAYILDSFRLSSGRRDASTASTGRSEWSLEHLRCAGGRCCEGPAVRLAARTTEEGDMSRFGLREIRVDNYRCFEELKLSLEEDTTVLFAENGGGKTALLTALAMGLARVPEGGAENPEARRAARSHDAHTRREGATRAGRPVQARVDRCGGRIGFRPMVNGSSSRVGRTISEHRPIFDALDRVRVPGDRWPLFAWYGVDRLGRNNGRRRRVERTRDRWEAYASALDPNLDEAPLLQWLQDEMLGDVARRQQEEPERFFDKAVMDATVRATPRVTNGLVRPGGAKPKVGFDDGHVATWSELSDGYHVFIALGRRHRPPRRHAQ